MPVVILTGATRGIGQAAAIELARRGAELGVVGRDQVRVRATAEEARAVGGGAPLHEHVADLERLDEVRRLAAELLEAYPRIDVLANNAGAMFSSRQVTLDGFERTFALNHLAPFLLTKLLLERLTASRGRVVTTASDAHKGGLLDLDDLQSERGRFRPRRVYGTTKLCNILFTRELQRRNPAIAANCFHPGQIRTGFGKNDSAGADQPHPGRALHALARERRPRARVARARSRRRRAARPVPREAAAGATEPAGAGRQPRRPAVGALGGPVRASARHVIRPSATSRAAIYSEFHHFRR